MPCPAIYERATQGRQPRGEASPFKSGDQESQCKALCLSSLWVLVQEHPETGQVPPGKPPWAGFRGGGGTNGGCKEEKDPDVAGHPQGNQPHAYHGNSPAVLQTGDSMCPTKSFVCLFDSLHPAPMKDRGTTQQRAKRVPASLRWQGQSQQGWWRQRLQQHFKGSSLHRGGL